MINAHGFKKIAQKIEENKRNISIGGLLYMQWPKHFGLCVCRRSEDTFEITLYNARMTEVQSFMDAMNALKHG